MALAQACLLLVFVIFKAAVLVAVSLGPLPPLSPLPPPRLPPFAVRVPLVLDGVQEWLDVNDDDDPAAAALPFCRRATAATPWPVSRTTNSILHVDRAGALEAHPCLGRIVARILEERAKKHGPRCTVVHGGLTGREDRLLFLTWPAPEQQALDPAGVAAADRLASALAVGVAEGAAQYQEARARLRPAIKYATEHGAGSGGWVCSVVVQRSLDEGWKRLGRLQDTWQLPLLPLAGPRPRSEDSVDSFHLAVRSDQLANLAGRSAYFSLGRVVCAFGLFTEGRGVASHGSGVDNDSRTCSTPSLPPVASELRDGIAAATAAKVCDRVVVIVVAGAAAAAADDEDEDDGGGGDDDDDTLTFPPFLDLPGVLGGAELFVTAGSLKTAGKTAEGLAVGGQALPTKMDVGDLLLIKIMRAHPADTLVLINPAKALRARDQQSASPSFSSTIASFLAFFRSRPALDCLVHGKVHPSDQEAPLPEEHQPKQRGQNHQGASMTEIWSHLLVAWRYDHVLSTQSVPAFSSGVVHRNYLAPYTPGPSLKTSTAECRASNHLLLPEQREQRKQQGGANTIARRVLRKRDQVQRRSFWIITSFVPPEQHASEEAAKKIMDCVESIFRFHEPSPSNTNTTSVVPPRAGRFKATTVLIVDNTGAGSGEHLYQAQRAALRRGHDLRIERLHQGIYDGACYHGYSLLLQNSSTARRYHQHKPDVDDGDVGDTVWVCLNHDVVLLRPLPFDALDGPHRRHGRGDGRGRGPPFIALTYALIPDALRHDPQWPGPPYQSMLNATRNGFLADVSVGGLYDYRRRNALIQSSSFMATGGPTGGMAMLVRAGVLTIPQLSKAHQRCYELVLAMAFDALGNDWLHGGLQGEEAIQLSPLVDGGDSSAGVDDVDVNAGQRGVGFPVQRFALQAHNQLTFNNNGYPPGLMLLLGDRDGDSSKATAASIASSLSPAGLGWRRRRSITFLDKPVWRKSEE